MSGPYLRTKPKFIRLHTMLGLSPQTARGLLEFLWDSVYDTGNADVGDADAVEAAAGWTGEPGEFCQALLVCGGKGKAGFIEEIPEQPGLYRLHDLLQHASPERVRVWTRQDERAERGSTISEIRRAAAKARLAKTQAADGSVGSQAAAERSVNGAPSATQAAPVQQPQQPQKPPANPFARPNSIEVSAHFKAAQFRGDPDEFMDQYVPLLPDPKYPPGTPLWKSIADRWIADKKSMGCEPYDPGIKRLYPPGPAASQSETR